VAMAISGVVLLQALGHNLPFIAIIAGWVLEFGSL